jgi:hypothetical protein
MNLGVFKIFKHNTILPLIASHADMVMYGAFIITYIFLIGFEYSCNMVHVKQIFDWGMDFLEYFRRVQNYLEADRGFLSMVHWVTMHNILAESIRSGIYVLKDPRTKPW